MRLLDRLTDRFTRIQPLPEGLHRMQSSAGDQPPYKLHLRLHRDGSAVLIINAATILQLNQTAAEYAYHFIKGTPPDEAAGAIAARYRVGKRTARQEFRHFSEQIHELVATPDLDPVSVLGLERVTPHSTRLSAPLRLDCALTYRLPPGAAPEAAPVKRIERELTTEEWGTILDRAWVFGIPHVTFTGGEPTLRADLPELIGRAERNGQVCGLLSDGLKLADRGYLDHLLQTGLDHLLFMLQPEQADSWKAIETVMPEDLFTTVHLTLTAGNAGLSGDALDRLTRLGVASLSLSVSEPGLKELLPPLLDRAADLGLALKYDLPVPYSSQHPVAFETAADQVPDGAGTTWLYVEPDGDVLPAQGMAEQVLGNLVRDPWETIYKTPL
jgi:hypothetical protein